MARSVELKLGDGRWVDAASLRRELSADIFQRQAHYDLTGAFARMSGVPDDVEPVLHNLLAMKSPLLRDVSAALFLVDHDPKGVREMRVSPDIAKVLRGFAPHAPITEQAGMDAELITRKTALTTVAKAIAHRLYRVRRKPYAAGRAVIRAWVDVTLKMYAMEASTAQVRVFPFPLNRRRQRSFVDELKRRRIEWTRDGLPYRLSAIPRLFMVGRDRLPQAIAQFEQQAFVDFASEVGRSGAGPIYTSDEFEVGSVAAGQSFRKTGIGYINSAHGVGFYCPRTAYSQFRYLTESQRDFYSSASPGTEFVRRTTSNFVLARPPSRDTDRLSVVFVHQDFESAGLVAEARVEREIMTSLDTMDLPTHVSRYVKIHPNADLQPFQSKVEACKIATAWDDIGTGKFLFLIINSTAFYDLVGAGDVAIFKKFSFYPEIYLEGTYRCFNLDTLTTMIEAWVESSR